MYAVRELDSHFFPWAVVTGPERAVVDRYHTSSGARVAARELNRGDAHVEPHRPLRCRIVPGAPRTLPAVLPGSWTAIADPSTLARA